MQSLSVKVTDWNPGDLIETQLLKIELDPNYIREILLQAIQDADLKFSKQKMEQILTISATFNPEIDVKITYKAGLMEIYTGEKNG